MKKPSVAIYSGDIPSTPFIENLVLAVAQAGYSVFIFGKRKKKISYANPNIHIYSTPVNKFAFGLWLGWYSFVLAITKPEKHKQLNGLVVSETKKGNNPTLVRARYLPVFLHTPDIFHVQWGRAASYWTEVGALLGMKLILSFRGAHINYAPLSDLALAETYRKVFPKFDAFHAVSEAIASEGRKYTSGNPLVRVIHSGINIAKTEISTRKSAPQNSPGTIRILSVGRFHWKKGYPVAFEAIRKLTGEGIRLKYELVAGGDDEEVVYMVNDMNLRDQVVFHGNMSQQQVFELMKECDLLLLPSVEEGIANVVLEAMAVGLPVISSDCGGMAEAVLEGETGLLFRSRNSDHLAARIREFLQMDAGKKSKMIMAARKHIHDNFSMERLGKEMDRLYKDVEQSKTGK